MTSHAIKFIKEQGLRPVLITLKQNLPVAEAMSYLNDLILWDNLSLSPISYYTRDHHPLSFTPISKESFHENTKDICIDLQVTSRSRTLLKYLKNELLFSKTISVPKRSFRRIYLVIRSRITHHQKPLLSKSFQPGLIVKTQKEFLSKHLFGDKGSALELPGHTTSEIIHKRAMNPTAKLPISLEGIEKFICVCPSASTFNKRWPKEYFRKFIEMILNKTQLNIVLCGGEDASQIGEYLEFIDTNRVFNLVNACNLSQTISILENASYVVSNDSFACHVCDALGTPASVIFGPTSPEFGFAPLNTFINIHYSHLSCSPCSRHGSSPCRFKNLACLKSISPETVFTAFLNGQR